MNSDALTFAFDSSVPWPEAEDTLRLAVLAAECLHGEDRVLFEVRTKTDPARRTCIIDTATEVGRTLAVVFGGYVRREFGDAAIRITRPSSPNPAPPPRGRTIGRR